MNTSCFNITIFLVCKNLILAFRVFLLHRNCGIALLCEIVFCLLFSPNYLEL